VLTDVGDRKVGVGQLQMQVLAAADGDDEGDAGLLFDILDQTASFTAVLAVVHSPGDAMAIGR